MSQSLNHRLSSSDILEILHACWLAEVSRGGAQAGALKKVMGESESIYVKDLHDLIRRLDVDKQKYLLALYLLGRDSSCEPMTVAIREACAEPFCYVKLKEVRPEVLAHGVVSGLLKAVAY